MICDSQEMSQSQSTVLPGHQTKERWGTNKDKTNPTYETTDTVTKRNCNSGTVLERSVGKYWGYNQSYSHETSPLILMQPQITDTVKPRWPEHRLLVYLGWFELVFESLRHSSDSPRKQIFLKIIVFYHEILCCVSS